MPPPSGMARRRGFAFRRYSGAFGNVKLRNDPEEAQTQNHPQLPKPYICIYIYVYVYVYVDVDVDVDVDVCVYVYVYVYVHVHVHVYVYVYVYIYVHIYVYYTYMVPPPTYLPFLCFLAQVLTSASRSSFRAFRALACIRT